MITGGEGSENYKSMVFDYTRRPPPLTLTLVLFRNYDIFFLIDCRVSYNSKWILVTKQTL